MGLKEWKFRKEVSVLPGISIKYGNGGIVTLIGNEEIDYEFESKKLRNELYTSYSISDEIRSRQTSLLTSQNLIGFKDLLLNADVEYKKTLELLLEKQKQSEVVTTKLKKLQNSILKLFFKSKLQKFLIQEQQLVEEIDELKEQLSCSIISLEINAEEAFSMLYERVHRAFSLLLLSQKKWDITSSKNVNQIIERTSATSTITRSEINVDYSDLQTLNYSQKVMRFKNMNGGDLYFYPGFLIYHENKNSFAIIDYNDFSIDFSPNRFIEEDEVPSDSKIIGETWLKVNKDGSPDRRFSNNYKIPIVQYGKIHFTSTTGINEVYSFSNYDSADLFSKAMYDYIEALKTAKSLVDIFGNV